MNKKDRNLHLTKKEENILSALTGRKVGGAALARELQLPRTTVDYLLRKLYAHGFIKRVYVGKKIMWTRETPEVCFELYEQFLNNLFGHQSQLQLQVNSGGYTRYLSGVSELFSVYESVASANINTSRTFQCIQPACSALISFEKIKNFQLPLERNVNYKTVDNTIVANAVLSENYYAKIASVAGKEWLHSFKNRTSATSMMPDEFIQFHPELFMFNGQVALMNWEDEYGLVIDHPAFFSMFQTFFTFMHHSGKKIDQNAHIKKLLEKMERKGG